MTVDYEKDGYPQKVVGNMGIIIEAATGTSSKADSLHAIGCYVALSIGGGVVRIGMR